MSGRVPSWSARPMSKKRGQVGGGSGGGWYKAMLDQHLWPAKRPRPLLADFLAESAWVDAPGAGWFQVKGPCLRPVLGLFLVVGLRYSHIGWPMNVHGIQFVFPLSGFRQSVLTRQFCFQPETAACTAAPMVTRIGICSNARRGWGRRWALHQKIRRTQSARRPSEPR